MPKSITEVWELNVEPSESETYYTVNRTSNQHYFEKKRMKIKSKHWFLVSSAILILLLLVAIGFAIYFGVKYAQSNNKSTTQPPPIVNWTSKRLPTSLKPIKYWIQVQPYFPWPGFTVPPGKNFTFDGNTSILFSCVESTAQVILNAKALTLISYNLYQVNPDGSQGKPIAILSVTDLQSTKFETLTFHLAQPFKQGNQYKLVIVYSGILDSYKTGGFYRVNYDEYGQNLWMAATQFEASQARRMFPSFDEPGFKATFSITVVHWTALQAVSNGMEIQTADIKNGWSVTSFLETPRMSSYLVAVVVHNFTSINMTTKHGTLIRAWARSSHINSAQYALEGAAKVLPYYEDYLGVYFPLKKLDLIALPQLPAGAMENWGLVTFTESAMLVDPKLGPIDERVHRVPFVVAHELAHQWFGNLVTCAWWDDLFLNEGFATYWEYVGTGVIVNSTIEGLHFFDQTEEIALARDEASDTHPVVDMNGPFFDTMTYDKGGSLLKMLNYTLTENYFRQGLHTYLKHYQYSSANHNDLWRTLTQSSWILDWDNKYMNVSAFMNPWVLQQNYPIINVTRNYTDGTAILTQKPFQIDANTTKPPKYQYQYTYLPFSRVTNIYVYTNLAAINVILGNLDNSQFLLLNPEVKSFYRVNYDNKNWLLIQQELQSAPEAIDVRSRSQLMDDVLNFMKQKWHNYTRFLELTRYLWQEMGYMPWKTVQSTFSDIDFMFFNSSRYPPWKSYLSSLVLPVYNKLGWKVENVPYGKYPNSFLRALIHGWTCHLESGDCVQQAVKKFQSFLDACKSSVSGSLYCSNVEPDLRKLVYCTGITHGTTSSWNLLFKFYESESTIIFGDIERKRLAYGLACTKNTNLIEKLINASLQTSDDGLMINLKTNLLAAPVIIQYLDNNFNYVNSRKKVSTLVKIASAYVNNPSQLSMLTDFAKKFTGKVAENDNKTLFNSIQQTEARIAWMKSSGLTIYQWLQNTIKTSVDGTVSLTSPHETS